MFSNFVNRWRTIINTSTNISFTTLIITLIQQGWKNFSSNIFSQLKKFGFYYCLYEFVFIYQMDRCYHLMMSKYSNLLWLIYWHFLPSASIFFTVLVYFLRRIISTFTQLYKLFFPTPNSIFSTCRRHRTTLHTTQRGVGRQLHKM